MKSLLYVVAFLSGMNLLAFELIGPKLLAPHFGTSFHVWSATLFVSLLGLAAGYYFSARHIQKKERTARTLALILALNAAVLIVVPLLAGPLFGLAGKLPFVAGILIAVSLLFFPVFFLLGTSSPLVIAALEKGSKASAKNPGRIFALSTIGGVLGIYLFGLDLIPEKGLDYAFYVLDSCNLGALFLCLLASKPQTRTS